MDILIEKTFVFIPGAEPRVFRAGEFCWNYGTSINNHLQHKKEKTDRENIRYFLVENQN